MSSVGYSLTDPFQHSSNLGPFLALSIFFVDDTLLLAKLSPEVGRQPIWIDRTEFLFKKTINSNASRVIQEMNYSFSNLAGIEQDTGKILRLKKKNNNNWKQKKNLKTGSKNTGLVNFWFPNFLQMFFLTPLPKFNFFSASKTWLIHRVFRLHYVHNFSVNLQRTLVYSLINSHAFFLLFSNNFLRKASNYFFSHFKFSIHALIWLKK